MTDLSYMIDFPQIGKLLALDIGTKTIGVAVSNKSQTVAFPKKHIAVTKDASWIHEVFITYVSEDACGLVVGLPCDASGNLNAQCELIIGMIKRMLRDNPGVSIIFVNEAFTTFEAEEQLNSVLPSKAGVPPKGDELLDARSASLILDRYLSTHEYIAFPYDTLLSSGSTSLA